MNRLTVIGRIVREIELREVGDGRIVMNNALAIPRTFKTNKGPDADFVDIVAWGKRAELIEEYCNKGELIGLDGRIQSRTYVDNNQQTVYVVEMVVESVHFLQQRSNNYKSKQSSSQQEHQNIQTANGPQQIEVNK